MTIFDPTTVPAHLGYLIRYTPTGPILNDPRILEALNYARQGKHKTFKLSTVTGGAHYHAELVDDDGQGHVMEWHGAGDTPTEAVRRLLGDVFGDWGLIDYAYRFGRVVDQWHRADEEALAVLDRCADGAPCR